MALGWNKRNWTLIMLALVAASLANAAIPNRPNLKKTLTFDAAKVLDDQTKEDILAAQLSAFKDQDVAVVVITLTSMSQYLDGAHDIADFANKWFTKWKIGKSGNGRGVLVIMSLHDRKVRIELGKDWGSRWDAHCQTIIDDRVIPRFKQKDYAGGMRAATLAVGEMAAIGPTGKVPKGKGMKGIVNANWFETVNRGNPIPSDARFFMLIAGAILIGLGFFLGQDGWWPIGIGILSILGVYAFWAAVVGLVLILMALQAMYGNHYHGRGYGCRSGYRRSSWGSSGGSSYSSSSSSGGFSSGGGGASGSW